MCIRDSIQGITEWLPISSTGHMILADEFMQLKEVTPGFINTFLVVIQFGSILAVIVMFFHKLNPFSPKKSLVQKKETFSLWGKVLVAVVPAAIIGFLFEDQIHEWLYNPTVIAIALIVYGVLFIVLELNKKKARVENFSQLTYQMALFIGVFQVLALIPGTSRSGATIPVSYTHLPSARPAARAHRTAPGAAGQSKSRARSQRGNGW